MNSSKQNVPRHEIRNKLVPPGGELHTSGKKKVNTALVLLVLFAVLLAGAIAVVRLQPTRVAESPPSPPPAEQAALPSEQADSSQIAAGEAREQLWSLKIEAEMQQVDKWGGEDYARLVAKLERADEQFRTGEFGDAARRYQLIHQDLQTLLGSKEQRLADALSQGRHYLSEEQPEEAQIQFRTALTIAPGNDEARSGLRQAQQRAEVIAGYRRALTLEENGRLEEAALQLESIAILGLTYPPALEAYKRIQQQLSEAAFSEAMANLLAALQRKDFSAAQRELRKLKQLGMRREEVAQAAALVAEQELRASVEAQREKAESLTETEQWQEALAVYETILQEAPEALFAAVGKEEAARRVQLDVALSDAIERPSRLQDEQQQAAVDQLLAYARSIVPQGPRLQSQISTLATLLQNARTPVTVIFESDDLTEVAIYHVGRLGTFRSKTISLKPGTYTVVGSKEGYRDVRKTITIEPAEDGYRFDIRCEEPI